MIADPVAKAEHLGRARSILFYLLATAFAASTLLGLHRMETPERLGVWLLLASLVAFNLTPLGGFLQPGTVTRLLNDETTRAHRRTSLAIGCWSAALAGMVLAATASALALNGSQAARLIVMICLAASLVSFATLELRAANG
jgi:hypothetical protein